MIIDFIGGPQDGGKAETADNCVVEGSMWPSKKLPCYLLVCDMDESRWFYVWTPNYVGMKNLAEKLYGRIDKDN